MGDGRIFLETFGASLFNNDLSNEPNLGQIHLGRQYLWGVKFYFFQFFFFRTILPVQVSL
jgi:hypothetical protein